MQANTLKWRSDYYCYSYVLVKLHRGADCKLNIVSSLQVGLYSHFSQTQNFQINTTSNFIEYKAIILYNKVTSYTIQCQYQYQ